MIKQLVEFFPILLFFIAFKLYDTYGFPIDLTQLLAIKAKGIETMKNEYHFPIQKCPKSLEYEAHTLRLPCNEHLKRREIAYVIEKVKEFYAQG